MTAHEWSAIVLAGGRGTRMGGADKAQLMIDGRTSLDLLLDSLPDGVLALVVGPKRQTAKSVIFLQEDPPGGGPLAAIEAAMSHVTTQFVAIIAVDMPFAVPVIARALQTLQVTEADACVPIDRQGRAQYLCAAWRTSALQASITRIGACAGLPARVIYEGASLMSLDLHASEGNEPDALLDLDTPSDLARLTHEELG